MQRLKLRRLWIHGFKALAGFELSLPDDLLILVGGNGAGKSTILQALAFIQYMAQGQPSQFFKDRGWTPAELRSRISTNLRSGILSYSLLLEGEDGRRVYWHFIWDSVKERLLAESLWVARPQDWSPRRLLHCPLMPRFGSAAGKIEFGDLLIQGIRCPGSVLAVIEPTALPDGQDRDDLLSVLAWGRGIYSLELLSPAEMRRGNRPGASDIGPRGERLGGFLASLPAGSKDRLVQRLQQFYPLKSIETTRKRAGWVDLRIAETYAHAERIGAAHISDGFLRLLGLAAIPEFGAEASMVLLDEVEDGIEPHILPRFIELIAREAPAQLVLTSHSPLLVNAFTPSQIAFVARGADGQTLAASFEQIKPLLEGLDYFGTGEIWANTDTACIGQWVREVQQASLEAEDKSEEAEVARFMGLA